MGSKTLKRKPIEKIEGFHFDPVAHAYTLDGKPMMGVTSILKIINKPALIQWAANMACDHIKALPEQFVDGIPYRLVQLFDIEEARTAHNKKKEDAGTKGTDVHEQIERYVKYVIELRDGYANQMIESELDELDLAGCRSDQYYKFEEWARNNNVRFLESEKRVYSVENWYAGTLDLIFEMEGKKWIGDVKTSSAIYPEFYLQMAAYQMALEEMGEHTDIAGAMVINVNKRGGFEIGRNYDYQGNKMAFLAALTLYKQLNAIK